MLTSLKGLGSTTEMRLAVFREEGGVEVAESARIPLSYELNIVRVAIKVALRWAYFTQIRTARKFRAKAVVVGQRLNLHPARVATTAALTVANFIEQTNFTTSFIIITNGILKTTQTKVLL